MNMITDNSKVNIALLDENTALKVHVERIRKQANIVFGVFTSSKSYDEQASVIHELKIIRDETPKQSLEAHDAEVRKAERERCVKICDREYVLMEATKTAHYRLSPEPFSPLNFCKAERLGELKYGHAKADEIRGMND